MTVVRVNYSPAPELRQPFSVRDHLKGLRVAQGIDGCNRDGCNECMRPFTIKDIRARFANPATVVRGRAADMTVQAIVNRRPIGIG